MKRVTLKEWFYSYLLSLLPTLALTIAVWTTASWVFGLPTSTILPDDVVASITAKFELISSWPYLLCLATLVVLLFCADLSLFFSKRKRGFWYRIGKFREKYALLTRIAAGSVIVPAIIAFLMERHHGMTDGYWAAAMLAGMYICLSAGSHFVGMQDLHPYKNLIFVLRCPPEFQRKEIRHHTVKRLEQLLGRFYWTGKVVVLCESDAHTIVLTLPLLLHESEWEDSERWRTLSKALYQEWREKKIDARMIDDELSVNIAGKELTHCPTWRTSLADGYWLSHPYELSSPCGACENGKVKTAATQTVSNQRDCGTVLG